MASTQVEQIKERLNIVDIVGGYVELHKAGRHYKGKSPFTNEKTPSFFVSPDRGMYYCFSSQKGGDMFTFIEEMEGVDFKGALKILADRAGVELVPEDPKKRTERDQQYALLHEATQFFFMCREKRNDVTEYVKKRGVKGETMHAWRIGYAPDEWRALRTHLHEKKFTDDQILRAGLIKRADGAKEPYDVFRDRVMFPIRDASGRVVAFSGRTLKSEEGVPKYVNSPETELFQKSEILYGYDKAKQGIRQHDFTLIVEGQFDVVLAHQAGYVNTIAVSGTALTQQHIALIERLSNRAVLALDADRAGVSAVKRSSEPMLSRGMDVKVAHMKEGKDPADVIREDTAEFKRIIGHATHVIEFLLRVLRDETKDDRAYKLRVREEILPLVLSIPNRIDREHFEGMIAEALGTTKDAIHYELERLAEEKKVMPVDESPHMQPTAKIQTTRKKDLIVHLYAVQEAVRTEKPELAGEIKRYLNELVSEKEIHEIIEGLGNGLSKLLFTTEKYTSEVSGRQLHEEVSDRLTELSHLIAKAQLALLRDKIRVAEKEMDEKKTAEYLTATKEAQLLLQKDIHI